MMQSNRYLVAAALIGAASFPISLQAALLASDDGSAFPAGGSGWATDWLGNQSGGVGSTDGSKLVLTQTLANNDGRMARGIGYNLNDLGAGEYLRVQYDVIIGSSLAAFTSANDQIGATMRIDAALTGGASADSTFIIRAYGDATGGAAQALAWGAYDGGKNNFGFNAALFQNTGMSLAVNTTYRFTIDIHADTLDYDISIFDGTTTATLNNLGWRTTLDQTNSTLVFLGRQSDVADNLSYGIDNIAVTVIPEPGAIGLIGLGALGLLRRRRA